MNLPLGESRCAVLRVMVLLALPALPLSGCGPSEKFDRHEVSGTVTYQGQPVESGVIYFEAADPSVGVDNLAPTCFVVIKDGTFKTPAGEMPTTGKYRLKVMGQDLSKAPPSGPIRSEDDAPQIPALFPPYELIVEIPPPDGRLEIVVPDRPKRTSR